MYNIFAKMNTTCFYTPLKLLNGLIDINIIIYVYNIVYIYPSISTEQKSHWSYTWPPSEELAFFFFFFLSIFAPSKLYSLFVFSFALEKYAICLNAAVR